MGIFPPFFLPLRFSNACSVHVYAPLPMSFSCPSSLSSHNFEITLLFAQCNAGRDPELEAFPLLLTTAFSPSPPIDFRFLFSPFFARHLFRRSSFLFLREGIVRRFLTGPLIPFFLRYKGGCPSRPLFCQHLVDPSFTAVYSCLEGFVFPYVHSYKHLELSAILVLPRHPPQTSHLPLPSFFPNPLLAIAGRRRFPSVPLPGPSLLRRLLVSLQIRPPRGSRQ